MKKKYLTFVLPVLLVQVLVGTASAQTAAGTASAQTADEVVEKHLAAVGGREALGKLVSRKSTGTVTLSTEAGEIPGSIEIYAKAPNKSRAYMKFDLSAMGGGEMILDQRFDGTAGYTLNSMQGESPIAGNQLENMRNASFPSALLSYKETGIKIEVLPKEKLGDKDAIVLLMTPKSGSAVRMFLDPETYLVARTVTKINSPQMGGDIVQTVELSDYRVADGVKVPFQVVNSNPMQSLTIRLDKVEHNGAVDDAMFVKK